MKAGSERILTLLLPALGQRISTQSMVEVSTGKSSNIASLLKRLRRKFRRRIVNLTDGTQDVAIVTARMQLGQQVLTRKAKTRQVERKTCFFA